MQKIQLGKTGKYVSQLVLAWLLHQRPLAVILLGASSLEQYEHNMAAQEIHLTSEQVAVLNAASA